VVVKINAAPPFSTEQVLSAQVLDQRSDSRVIAIV